MQLTLSSSPFSKPPVAPKPVRQPAPPLDAAAMCQLDQIAAQNLQTSRQGLGGGAMLLALVGGLVILGSASMWSAGTDAPSKPAAVVAEARPAPVADVVLAQTPPVAVAPPIVATIEQTTMPAAPQPALAAAVAAEPVALVDDAARKARAAKAAEARRKATQLAQERALAEEAQRLQLAQQREAERAQQQQQLAEQARQRAATEQMRLASLQLAATTQRSVADMCSGAGNFISQQFCRSRECGKAEQYGDAACVRLRENELAQQRASIER